MLLVQVLRDRVSGRADEGQALVLVIGMVIVMAGILTVVASTTVFGSFFTTQSRASVESQAAADAGVDVAYASMVSDLAACTAVNGHFVSGSVPAYDVQVSYQQVKDGTWTDGCPDLINKANWPEQVRVVSTGTAQRQGTGGFEAGDKSTVEALWTKPVDPPTFNHAVRADTFVGTNAIQSIASDEDDATIFTKGNLACDAGTKVPGSLYVKGDVYFKNSACGTDQDMYVGGSLYFPAATGGTTVGGNLTVFGNIASNNYPWPVSKFTTARYFTAAIPRVTGEVRAGGYLDGYCSYDNITAKPGSVFAPYKDKEECSTSADFGTPTKTFMLDPTVPDPDTYSVFNEKFEVFRPDLEYFDNYTAMSWDDSSFPTNLIHGAECRTNNTPGTMVIAQDTIIDTTSQCADGVHMGFGGNVTIELYGDLVVFGSKITKDLALSIVSGDGEKHSVYFATPTPDGFTDCPAPKADSTNWDPAIPVGIQFKSGPMYMDANTALLAYTTDTFLYSNGGNGYAGQIYACQSNWQPSFGFTYRKVGDNEVDASFTSYTMQYIRQG